MKLESAQRALGEVVVIGYGVQRKSDLTGSVSNVSSKDFNQGVVNSPEQLINGKVSGVQIVSGGGSPSAGSTIRIRGGASLNASNDPLIVLDGVPMEVGASVSGSGNFLSLINPNDIENMTILKDAASTAIYGSRASNGVILITTKKGAATSRPRVSFSTTNAMSYRTRTPAMMGRGEMYDLVNAKGTDAQKALLDADVDTDWNDVIYRKAFSSDNNIGISGQLGGLLPYRLSLGYSNQDGILRTDNVTRYTGSLTLSPSLLDNHLKLVINAKATRSDNRFANTLALWGGATHSPFSPVRSGKEAFLGYDEAADADGVPITGATANPLGLLENYHSTSDVWRYVGSLDADYSLHFLPELHAHVTLGLDNSRGEGHVFVPAAAYQHYLTKGRNYDYGPQKNTNRLATVYFNYNKYFENIKSNVDVTVGYDYQYWKYTNAAYLELNDADPQEKQAAAAADDQRHVLLSYYGRLNYSFASRYLLSFSLRRDGSSRFGKANRWGTFPSLALGWRIHEEPFFEPLRRVVDNLKLRASYGVTGQQDGIANYGHLPLYTLSQSGAHYMFGGKPIATYRPSAYNANLKWETTRAFNIGLDLGFRGDRLSGSIDYYSRKTEDLLATVPVAAGTNFNKQILTNVGNISSSGVEFSLKATPFRTENFAWDLASTPPTSTRRSPTCASTQPHSRPTRPPAPSNRTTCRCSPRLRALQLLCLQADIRRADGPSHRRSLRRFRRRRHGGQPRLVPLPLTRAHLDIRLHHVVQLQEVDAFHLAARQRGQLSLQRHGDEHWRLGDDVLQQLPAQPTAQQLSRHRLPETAARVGLLRRKRLLPEDGQHPAGLQLRPNLQVVQPQRLGHGAERVHHHQLYGCGSGVQRRHRHDRLSPSPCLLHHAGT
ncbi:SusC/RagA family TonB-linked outer membrane protein [Segatella baroniae]|uniref:SusC/RagA family TonB-linked outer membrane protein n=1 Tax=Segatella baroniae TaxID=305719 RepID=UPI000AD27001